MPMWFRIAERRVIFGRLEDRAPDVRAVRRFRREPEHAMAATRLQCVEQALQPGVTPLDHDHPVLPESPFPLAISGIEILVVLPKLAENLWFTVSVIAEFRPFDLQEITEGLAGSCGIGDVEERVRMDRVLEVFLPPQISEALRRAQAVEGDMERC
jgi:hypothetical protein